VSFSTPLRATRSREGLWWALVSALWPDVEQGVVVTFSSSVEELACALPRPRHRIESSSRGCISFPVVVRISWSALVPFCKTGTLGHCWQGVALHRVKPAFGQPWLLFCARQVTSTAGIRAGLPHLRRELCLVLIGGQTSSSRHLTAKTRVKWEPEIRDAPRYFSSITPAHVWSFFKRSDDVG